LLGFLDEKVKSGLSKKELDGWCKKGFVIYLGETDNAIPYIVNTNRVVSSSFYAEGTPISLLEAAALGKLIITTNNVGCKEVVIDGSNGYLCEKESLSSLVYKWKSFFF
jgi:glycosyltransferase involved in cell wall biosynthesis